MITVQISILGMDVELGFIFPNKQQKGLFDPDLPFVKMIFMIFDDSNPVMLSPKL